MARTPFDTYAKDLADSDAASLAAWLADPNAR